MNREWFTIAELRAAKCPAMPEGFFGALLKDFPLLTYREGRYRYSGDAGKLNVAEEEFHWSLFLEMDREHLRRVFSGGDFARILKLGIHRPVADPRAYYVPVAERPAA